MLAFFSSGGSCDHSGRLPRAILGFCRSAAVVCHCLSFAVKLFEPFKSVSLPLFRFLENGKPVSFSLFRFLQNGLLFFGEFFRSLDGFRGQELPQSCFQLVNGVIPLIDLFLRGRQRVALGGSFVDWYFFHPTTSCHRRSRFLLLGSNVPTDGANVKVGSLTIVQRTSNGGLRFGIRRCAFDDEPYGVAESYGREGVDMEKHVSKNATKPIIGSHHRSQEINGIGA
ncbi:hypothetical protein PIB30_094824 [Stylosanthes scabra]|uniref:Uncharacterized protein n=1 Tax=Stylosanthes scabra TaxID=79078 RepID=A0ABU6XUU9_9FABA|nr:hypothetical protein [Stylosanthes scabra]